MLPHEKFQSFVHKKYGDKSTQVLNRLKLPYIPSEKHIEVPPELTQWSKGGYDDLDFLFKDLVLRYDIRNIVDTLLIKNRSLSEISFTLYTSKKEQIPEKSLQLYQRLIWDPSSTSPNDWDIYINFSELQGLGVEATNKKKALSKPFVELQWDLGLLPDVGIKDLLGLTLSSGTIALYQLLADSASLSIADKLSLVKQALRAGDLLNRITREEEDNAPEKAIHQLKLELDTVKEKQEMSIVDLKSLLGDKVLPSHRTKKEG